MLHRASEAAVEGEWLTRGLDAINKPGSERCRREAELGAARAQEARQQRKLIRDTIASVLEPDRFQHPSAEPGSRITAEQEPNRPVEAREESDAPSPGVPRGPRGNEPIDQRAEQGPEATAPIYKFDVKTEAYIAAEVKGMDPHLARDPALRMDLAFEWSIKKDLDPKGPPFETLEGSGFLDDERGKFYAKHAKALPRAQDVPAHVREAEDKKSAEQEAAKGGRTLTAAERASASPELKTTLDRKEREKRAIEIIRSRGDGRTGRDGRGGGGKDRGGGRGR